MQLLGYKIDQDRFSIGLFLEIVASRIARKCHHIYKYLLCRTKSEVPFG